MSSPFYEMSRSLQAQADDAGVAAIGYALLALYDLLDERLPAVPADPVRELVCNSVGYHLPHGWHNGPGTPRYRCPGNLNPCLCGHHEVDHVAGEHGHQCGACGCESFAPTPVPADPNEKD